MKTIGEVFESPQFSAHLAEGRRLLLWQRAADAALTELGGEGGGLECRVTGATGGTTGGTGGRLELQAADAATATRLRHIAPAFLAAFNRAAKTEMREMRIRVAPGN